MPRGRPPKSRIRQNLIELVSAMGKGYGYEIYKNYRELFPKAAQRSIYYHLKKGTQLGEFELHGVVTSQGQYSWGRVSEKVIYKLGPNGMPKGDERVRKFFMPK